jgi:hypothetical protein
MERRLQQELEARLPCSPAELAASRPAGVFGAMATELVLAGAGGDVRAIRFVFSFLLQRGHKPPRRARLPLEMRRLLIEAHAAEQPATQTAAVTSPARTQGNSGLSSGAGIASVQKPAAQERRTRTPPTQTQGISRSRRTQGILPSTRPQFTRRPP